MLFSSSILGNSCIFMIYVGLLVGIVYEICVCVRKILLSNIAITICCDIVFGIILVFAFFFGINYCNYGQFRVFLLISYLFAFWLERTTIGFLVAKLINFIYNQGRKLLKKGRCYDRKQT